MNATSAALSDNFQGTHDNHFHFLKFISAPNGIRPTIGRFNGSVYWSVQRHSLWWNFFSLRWCEDDHLQIYASHYQLQRSDETMTWCRWINWAAVYCVDVTRIVTIRTVWRESSNPSFWIVVSRGENTQTPCKRHLNLKWIRHLIECYWCSRLSRWPIARRREWNIDFCPKTKLRHTI